jgi:hypothetical protein
MGTARRHLIAQASGGKNVRGYSKTAEAKESVVDCHKIGQLSRVQASGMSFQQCHPIVRVSVA